MSDNDKVFILRQNACQLCLRRAQCPAFDQNAPGASQGIQRATRAGQNVFKAGDAFEGVHVVRSGFFKSYFIDSEGEMQITGFHFPGEVFGIDGIDTGVHGTTVEALDTGSLCRIPLAAGADGAAASPRFLMSLVKVMSRAVARDERLIFALGKMSARRRFAAFLLDVADRMEASGYGRDSLRLCMSRIDIANYLGLAVETVSRLFTLFQGGGLLQVNRRELAILDREGLEALVRGEAGSEEALDRAAHAA